jgi:hypothetical protein
MSAELKHLYRYEDVQYAPPSLDDFPSARWPGQVRVNLITYYVWKQTPCGAWVSLSPKPTPPRQLTRPRQFVRLTAKRPHALPTKEEALAHFIIRKKLQRGFVQRKLNRVDRALEIAEKLQQEAGVQNGVA